MEGVKGKVQEKKRKEAREMGSGVMHSCVLLWAFA